MSRTVTLPEPLVAWIDRAMPALGGAGSVTFRYGPQIPFDWLPGDRQRYTAITLWETVHVRDRGVPFDLDDPYWLELVLHELVHVEQFRRTGTLAFPAWYVWGLARHGYGDHPAEREARARAAELLQRFAAEHR